MTPHAFDTLKGQFNDYARAFHGPEGTLPFALQLKLDHSHRVADEAASIAEELEWSADSVLTGRAAGLLHDIGRFTQYAQFKTFADARSLNHGEQGHAVLQGHPLLDGGDPAESRAILDAVRHHNCRTLPEGIPLDSLPVLRLVRDADKLDIIHLINEFVRSKRLDDYPEILLHTDTNGPPTAELIRELRENRTASYRHVHSLADINLMRVAWVYNVNYLPTLRSMQKRRLFDDLEATLPADPEVRALVADAHAYMAERLREGRQVLHA